MLGQSGHSRLPSSSANHFVKVPAWSAKDVLRVFECVLRHCRDRDVLLKRDAGVEGCVLACLRHMATMYAAFGCMRSFLPPPAVKVVLTLCVLASSYKRDGTALAIE